jgi:hypothetical protein
VAGKPDRDVLEVVLPRAVDYELFSDHNLPSLAGGIGRERMFGIRPRTGFRGHVRSGGFLAVRQPRGCPRT